MWSKKSFGPKNHGLRENFDPKKVLVQKLFGLRENFGPKNVGLKKNLFKNLFFCLMVTDSNASACAKNWGWKDFPTMFYDFSNM